MAALLQMTPEEKQAYQQQRRQQLEREAAENAAALAAGRYEEHTRAEAEVRYHQWEQQQAWARQQREQAAGRALTEVRAWLARGEYLYAAGLARRGAEDYADTAYGREFVVALASAETEMAALRDDVARRQAQEQARQEAQRQERHRRFIRHRNEGIAAMDTAHPDVPLYTAAVDRQLDEHGYIVPGLGDAGDRIFGTK